jgi:hypothetical protein
MPSTASGLAVLPFEKYENLDGTARYLRRLLNRFASLPFDVRYERALAGYNAGPEAVERYGGIPPYAETRAYVARVVSLWHQIASMIDSTQASQLPVALDTPAPRPTFAALPNTLGIASVEPAPKPKLLAKAKLVDSRPVWSIGLAAPVFVADGEPIPVSLHVHGTGTVMLVEKIGPTVIEKRAIASSTVRVALRPLPLASRTRIVMLQATAPGVRSRQAWVAAVSPATRSAFVPPL